MIPTARTDITMRAGPRGVLEHVPPTGDTTAPVVTPPADTTIQFANGGAGLAHNDPTLQSWLAQASAVDETDGAVTVTNNLTAYADPLPAGTVTIQFSATDVAGNTGTATANLTVSEQGVAGAWQLSGDGVSANSHWVAAKIPMHPVFPRPDSETQAHARHRLAHPDFRYEIPIGVQGGAWPFKYEIINGPSGATIGQYYGDLDYGVLKWVPAVGDSGTKTFTVRVTDQELNTVDLTWTTTIDANQFVFVDAGATVTGAGTIGSPLKTFADWYKGDRADSTYLNKIVVFRSGIYSVVGDPTTNNNVWLDANSKTTSWIGYPDEYPVLDCSSAKVLTNANLNDQYFSGLIFQNARTDVNNPHYFWVTSSCDRGVWFNNTFKNFGMGLGNDDNPAAIFMSRIGGYRQNILICNNTFENFTATGGNGGYIDFYSAKYILIEGNTVRNGDTSYGFWLKEEVDSYVTVRNITATDNVRGKIVTFQYANPTTPTDIPHDFELCWCNLNTNDDPARIIQSSQFLNQHYNTFVYRNTLSGYQQWLRFPGAEPYKTDGNVVVESTAQKWSGSQKTVIIPNIVGAPADSIIDATGNLTGAWRTQYLGTRGHEVY